jgi:hypothetical protein
MIILNELAAILPLTWLDALAHAAVPAAALGRTAYGEF